MIPFVRIDLIYEGIATGQAFQLIEHQASAVRIDLIYEGIATFYDGR